jgi:quercetin dioxygenase-like cupin family protein
MEVVSLLDGKPLDPKPVLAGGWRWLRMLTLGPRESERLEAVDVEYAVYGVEGEGTAQLADRTVRIGAGSALTLLNGAEPTLGATGGLTLFLVAVDVPNR